MSKVQFTTTFSLGNGLTIITLIGTIAYHYASFGKTVEYHGQAIAAIREDVKKMDAEWRRDYPTRFEFMQLRDTVKELSTKIDDLARRVR